MPIVISGTNGISGVDGTASNPSYEGTDANTGVFFPAADTVAIGTNGTEALRVNSSQIVQLAGGSTNTTYTSAGQLAIKRSNSAPFVSFHGDDGTRIGYLQMQQTGVASLVIEQNQPLTFGTNGTERARFNAGASILCLSGGNTSATGTGIAFPATQSASSDANTLDDYEEGTWNITVSYSGSTSGVTYAARTGYYTKMGNVVMVQGAVSLSSKGTGSGTVRISLPFQTIGDRGGLAVGNTQEITANNSPRELMVEGATSYCVIRYPTGTGGTAEILYGDISNSFYLVFGGTYLTST
jgi:hypothetical protein